MTILVTAFDPFGGESINPAREAAAALPEQIGGAWIVTLWITTVFEKGAAMVTAAMDQLRPNILQVDTGSSAYTSKIPIMTMPITTSRIMV